MKPMGRKKIRFPSKTDCHPKNGFVNWWENVVNLSKKRERRNAKREIRNDFADIS